jgi:tRNA A-37 threonylcarbamoyl transferase component Bud32
MNFQPKIMNYIKNYNGKTIIFLVVDQWVFERDIERGFLGEALASKLIFPYLAIEGNNYLKNNEVKLKQRLILECLQNLILSYPELVYQIKILPEYFLYEIILNRLRVFPLLWYGLSGFIEGEILNIPQALSVYFEALTNLEKDNKIIRQEGVIKVSKKFIISAQKTNARIINISKNAQRTLFTHLFGTFPQLINSFAQTTVFLRAQKNNWKLFPEPTFRFVDPQKFLFVPTSQGIVSLAERIDIKGYAKKMFAEAKKIDVTPVGSMLNDVFVLKATVNGEEKRVLVKRFKDWSGFKWFPLNMWSFGARSFAVSGRARLAKECATSEFLRCRGFRVPAIYGISNAERLVFMEFIDGEDLSFAIKRIAVVNCASNKNDLSWISLVGENFARIHNYDLTLGDTKPENIIITKENSLCFLDFEQATQNGDKAWDIAEFLYYCGHYLQPLSSNGKAVSITRAFIEGYLKAGGDADNIKKASRPKYTRVFTIFTMPFIILSIANVCKKAGETQ